VWDAKYGRGKEGERAFGLGKKGGKGLGAKIDGRRLKYYLLKLYPSPMSRGRKKKKGRGGGTIEEGRGTVKSCLFRRKSGRGVPSMIECDARSMS